MIGKSYIIGIENGIHARPAGIIVSVCSKFKSDIKFSKDEQIADGKSLFSVISLGAINGDILHIKIEGEDEIEADIAIKNLLMSEEFKSTEIPSNKEHILITSEPKSDK